MKRFVKWFVAAVEPWFVRYVWPVIKEWLETIFKKTMDDINSTFYKWWEGRPNDGYTQATRRAGEADKKAAKSTTEDEAREHRKIAQVWREVAEEFRRENEELKAKLDEALRHAKSTFTQKLNSLDVKNVVKQADDGSLRLTGPGTRLALPALGAESFNGDGRSPKADVENRDDEGVDEDESKTEISMADVKELAAKLGLDIEQIPEDKLWLAINHVIDAIMEDDPDSPSEDDDEDD